MGRPTPGCRHRASERQHSRVSQLTFTWKEGPQTDLGVTALVILRRQHEKQPGVRDLRVTRGTGIWTEHQTTPYSPPVKCKPHKKKKKNKIAKLNVIFTLSVIIKGLGPSSVLKVCSSDPQPRARVHEAPVGLIASEQARPGPQGPPLWVLMGMSKTMKQPGQGGGRLKMRAPRPTGGLTLSCPKAAPGTHPKAVPHARIHCSGRSTLRKAGFSP